jgi:predicted aspartyl protease
MIQGTVRDEEARIRLNVNGLRGREQQIEALIDTGYTGFLTLPPRLITALALRWAKRRSGHLG